MKQVIPFIVCAFLFTFCTSDPFETKISDYIKTEIEKNENQIKLTQIELVKEIRANDSLQIYFNSYIPDLGLNTEHLLKTWDIDELISYYERRISFYPDEIKSLTEKKQKEIADISSGGSSSMIDLYSKQIDEYKELQRIEPLRLSNLKRLKKTNVIISNLYEITYTNKDKEIKKINIVFNADNTKILSRIED
jgi:hypothetical protein